MKIRILVLVLYNLFCHSVLDWRKPYKPCARSGHAAVADDNNLYIFGGYNPDLETLQDYFGRNEEMLFPLFQEVRNFCLEHSLFNGA